MRTVLAQREAAGKVLITSTRRPPAGRLVLASALLLGLAGWLLGDVSAATPAPRPAAGTPTSAIAPAPRPSAATPADHAGRMRHHTCRAAASPRCASASHRHRRHGDQHRADRRPGGRHHGGRHHADRRRGDRRDVNRQVQSRRR